MACLKIKLNHVGPSARVKANSVLGVKMVTPKLSINLICGKCEWNLRGSGAGRKVM